MAKGKSKKINAVINRHSAPVLIPCQICGKQFAVRPADLKDKHLVTACSIHFK